RNRNRSVMIANDGLHNGEAKTSSLLLRRVVRRKESRDFLGCQTLSSVRDFDTHAPVLLRRTKSKSATGRHSVECVEHEILKRAMQQVWIGVDFGKGLGEKGFGGDVWLADFVELRLEEAHRVAKRLVHVDFGEMRRRHFGEIAEPSNDGVEIRKFRFQR